MLWQSKPVSVESAVRAQACALDLHFVLSKTPEAVENNYVHGLAAHLLTFMLQISRLGGRLVDFFEEAGEREAAVIRDFVQLNSNFKDNLFMGARVAESMSQKIRLSRQRRAKCDETDLSNVLIAPCLLQRSALAVDTLRSFVLDVMRCGELQKFIWLDGDCVFFVFLKNARKAMCLSLVSVVVTVLVRRRSERRTCTTSVIGSCRVFWMAQLRCRLLTLLFTIRLRK
jgi:hypothetical protein